MSEQEEWRPVPGADGFWASSLGRIRAEKRPWIRKPGMRTQFFLPDGHLNTCIKWDRHPNHGAHGVGVHRVIARTFIGPEPDSPGLWVVDHVDHDKTNNRADNLEWVTHGENTRRSGAFHRARRMAERTSARIATR